MFAKPLAAAIFLTINGVILLVGERFRRRAAVRELVVAARHRSTARRQDGRRLDTLDFREAGVIGVAQIGALFAGISRSGITMVAGLVRGLDHEDAARFSFLLATPIILAAGLYKIPDLTGPLGNGIRGQVLVGAIVRRDRRLRLGPVPRPVLRDQERSCRSPSTASSSAPSIIRFA